MIDFSLSEDQRDIRDTVRRFVSKEVMPLEAEMLERERQGLPGVERSTILDLQQRGRRSGLWGLETPTEFGGVGVGPVTCALVSMELGRSFVPFKFGGTADNILYACTPEQAETYLKPTIEGQRISCFALTEPGAGSDARNLRTRAVRSGDDWVLTGEKTFISNGNEADFAIVFAVTDPDQDGDQGVTAFLVDREMGWTSSPIPTMGGWSPASLSFDDVRVPSRNVLGELGKGFPLAMQWISNYRFITPARVVGSGERLLEMAMEHAKNRVSMGHPIADYQAIQWQIADSHVEVESVKWLTLHAAWRLEQGLDARHAASIAKLTGGLMANQVVDRVLQIHGGMGFTKELPIERWYREFRIIRIYDGTDEIQRRAIARNLLKGYVKLGSVGE